MEYDLTLIETEKLEELIEDAFILRQLEDPVCGYVLNSQVNWDKLKKDKEKFLSAYVNIPLNLTEDVEKTLEERGYKKC